MFLPDRYNYQKQSYCEKEDCRKVSKKASQKKWSNENPDYFKGQINVKRVQEWRKEHPDYSIRATDPGKKPPQSSPTPAQNVSPKSTQPADTETPSSNSLQDSTQITDIETSLPVKALQDFAFPHPIDIKELNDTKKIASALTALQDFAIWQTTVLQGFAAHLYGDGNDALQDFAISFLGQCYDKGKSIFTVSAQGATTSNSKER